MDRRQEAKGGMLCGWIDFPEQDGEGSQAPRVGVVCRTAIAYPAAMDAQVTRQGGGRPALATGGRRRFGELEARLPDLLDDLLACEPLGVDGAAVPNQAGVYLFSRAEEALYIGQTRKLRQRMRNHRGATSTHNQASFAFLLARELVIIRHPGFEVARSRSELAADPAFAAIFLETKAEIRSMALRFVEIDDPVLRTLFEVYAALALGTPYNDFDTH